MPPHEMTANNSSIRLIGIDFGTTKTMAAEFNRSSCKPERLKLGLRDDEIPTAVYQTDDGQVLFGEAADREGESDHLNYIHRFKMKLGEPGLASIGRKPASAEQLTAEFLRHVSSTLKSEVLHCEKDSDLERAVLTIPAIFLRHQKDELERAAETAGFKQVVLLPEPVAAGMAYCHNHPSKGSGRFLVVDWGGGTFDVALVERSDDGGLRIKPEFVDGLMNIGGEVMDDLLFVAGSNALTSAGLGDLGNQGRTTLGKYKREITRAKKRLSDLNEVEMSFVLSDGTPSVVEFKRSVLEETLYEMVIKGVRFVKELLQRCQEGACFPDFVLLAGGVSRIPMVKRVFEVELAVKCVTWTQGHEAIALGAALKARDLWGSTESNKPQKQKNIDAESLAAANEAERLAATDRKATDRKATDRKATDRKATDRRAADRRAADRRAADRKAAAAKAESENSLAGCLMAQVTREQVLEAIGPNISECDDQYTFVFPYIPPKKLGKAIAAYAPVAPSEVLLLHVISAPIFGFGEHLGFILTRSHLLWKQYGEQAQSLHFSEIQTVEEVWSEFLQKGLKINGIVLLTPNSSTGFTGRKFCSTLKKIILAIRRLYLKGL